MIAVATGIGVVAPNGLGAEEFWSSLLSARTGIDRISRFDPAGLIAQMATRRMSTSTDPETAYQPFSADASGYVPGEGGAMIIFEDAANARRRGAGRSYGMIAGYAATFDPPPGSPRPPGLRRVIELALADAGITAADVGAVLADGHATPELDRREAAALTEVFGPHGVPVTVPKTLNGRMYSGGSALDVVTGLLMLRDQVIPPTAGLTDVHPDYPLDLVPGLPREARLRNVLVLSRGYGGLSADQTCFNTAVVLSTAQYDR
jgi:act minimal PKS chain-length factor (CLF/KS beta)